MDPFHLPLDLRANGVLKAFYTETEAEQETWFAKKQKADARKPGMLNCSSHSTEVDKPAKKQCWL